MRVNQLTCGKKNGCEDFSLIKENFRGRKRSIFGLICDGHGGIVAPRMTINLLPQCFGLSLDRNQDPIESFNEAFEQTSFEVEGQTSSGAAVLALYINDQDIYVANAGDCRALLVRKKDFLQLTNDHVLSNQKERKRIEGYQTKCTQSMIKVGGQFITMTRSIGDRYFKSFGVIARPEVCHYKIKAGDVALIAGSDGLFTPILNREVANFFRRDNTNFKEKIKELVFSAYARFGSCSDDITAMGICFE